MAQYIDKDALVAEIEKLIDEIYAGRPFDSLSREQQVALWYVKSIMSSINTLEVKEVDLDEAARKWEDKVYLEKGWQDEYGTPHAPFSEIGNAFREGAKFMIKAQKGE